MVMNIKAAGIAVGLAAALASAPVAALDIVRLGRPAAAVLVDPAAPPSAKFAAQELVNYVKAITGVELKRIERPNTAWKTIRIGRPPAATNGVDEIACFINAKGELELTGAGPRAPVFAVYKFLERSAGVRYWSPWREEVPRLKKFSVPKTFELRHVPSFEWRDGWGVSDNGRPSVIRPWKRKIGHNSAFTPETGAGRFEASIGETMMNLFLRPDRYFAAHPDWYALRDGKREGSQMCAASAGAMDRLVEEVREYLREHPGTRVLAMSSQDNDRFCRCEKCAKTVERGGCGNMVLEVQIVNETARRLRMEFPAVRFALLAYWTKEAPPLKLKLEPNVDAGLAIARNMVAPVDRDAQWMAKVKGWRKAVKGDLYFWDYYANFRNFNEPRPDFINMAANLRCYRKFGMKGGFAQMRLGELANFGEMLAYLWGQLLWDCEQDENALIAEYIRGNYGAGAADVEAYWRLQVESMRKYPKANMGMYHSNYDEWFKARQMFQSWELVNRAMEATKDDRIAHRKVEYLYCAVLNDFCLRWDRQDIDHAIAGVKLKYPLPVPWDMVDELDDLRQEYGAGYWGEHREWDSAIEEFRRRAAAHKADAARPGAFNPYGGRNFRTYTRRQIKPRSKAQQY